MYQTKYACNRIIADRAINYGAFADYTALNYICNAFKSFKSAPGY